MSRADGSDRSKLGQARVVMADEGGWYDRMALRWHVRQEKGERGREGARVSLELQHFSALWSDRAFSSVHLWEICVFSLPNIAIMLLTFDVSMRKTLFDSCVLI